MTCGETMGQDLPFACVACGKPAQFPLHDECRGSWVHDQRERAYWKQREANDRRAAISTAVAQVMGAKR